MPSALDKSLSEVRRIKTAHIDGPCVKMRCLYSFEIKRRKTFSSDVTGTRASHKVMQDKEHTFILRVLIIQQDDLWAAQCIDRDIVAQGRSISEAKRAFERTVIGQILFDIKNNREPLAAFPPAPQELRELFEKAADVTLDDKGSIFPPDTPAAFICNQITKEFRVFSD